MCIWNVILGLGLASVIKERFGGKKEMLEKLFTTCSHYIEFPQTIE
jgi:hypothetical protein